MAQFNPPKGDCRSNSHGQEYQPQSAPDPARTEAKSAATESMLFFILPS